MLFFYHLPEAADSGGSPMEMKFYDYLDANPVIAAVKDMDGVKKCCEREEIKIVFILFGDVCSICRIVEELKAHGKRHGPYGSCKRSQRKGSGRGLY